MEPDPSLQNGSASSDERGPSEERLSADASLTAPAEHHLLALSSDPGRLAPVASYLHTGLLIAIMAGLVAFSALKLGRGNDLPGGPLGTYLSTMVWQWAIFGFIVVGMRMHGARVAQILGLPWRNVEDFLMDLLVAVGFWLISIVVLALLRYAFTPMPDLSHANPAQTKQAVDSALKGVRGLIPHTRREYIAWVFTAITAGIVEEFIFRGYLQRQFIALTRNAFAGIVITAALFGAAHLYQGYSQMAIIAVYGTMFGALAHWRKSIKPGMLAHAWQDILSMLLAGWFSSHKF